LHWKEEDVALPKWSLEAQEEVLAAEVQKPPLHLPLQIDVEWMTMNWLPIQCPFATESRRAVATASNEPTKTHERLVREELALPFVMIDLMSHAATVRRTMIPW
jgi:hypothetical protein